MPAPPKWRRRKEARPVEIIESALAEFADKGFANARLDAIAQRAGISKAALYRYFDTKEDLFRAVAATSMAPNVNVLMATAADFGGPFEQMLPALLDRIACLVKEGRLPAVIRLVIGESRTFPELARIWHDTIVEKMVGALEAIILQAQRRGELKDCDARLLALTLVGPLAMGMLFREVFGASGVGAVELQALAAQHAGVVLHGVLPGERHET